MTRADFTEGAVRRPSVRAPVVSPTPRQLAALVAIDDGWKKQTPVSIRELGDALGIRSTNGVSDHLNALERKGLIQRPPMRARLIRLTRAGKAAVWAHRLRMAAPEVSR